jgi:hypothetical protein
MDLNQTRPDEVIDVRAFTVETVRKLGYDVRAASLPITQLFASEDLAARLRSVLDSQDSSRHVN